MAAAGPGAGPWAAAVKNGAAALAANGATLPSQFFSFDYPEFAGVRVAGHQQLRQSLGIFPLARKSGETRFPGNAFDGPR